MALLSVNPRGFTSKGGQSLKSINPILHVHQFDGKVLSPVIRPPSPFGISQVKPTSSDPLSLRVREITKYRFVFPVPEFREKKYFLVGFDNQDLCLLLLKFIAGALKAIVEARMSRAPFHDLFVC